MAEIKTSITKINIASSLLNQIVTLISGLLIPRMMIGSFGSEVYGATTSISQLLAYITLLEGGIGGVARSVLYRPLANQDLETVSLIIDEVKRFFRIIAGLFVIYVLCLAFGFKELSNISCMDWISTFVLVISISVSTFGQYFIGISYSLLLQADQKIYVTNLLSACVTFFNAVFTIILIRLNCNILIVKSVSSIIFFLRPIILMLYAKYNYPLINPIKKHQHKYLKNKWTGLGQHFAFFLHSNTDIVILTFFSNLQSVAVYSVYNMILSHLQSLTISFSSGMEAEFGKLIAIDKKKELVSTFRMYEWILSFVSTIFFSVTMVLIVPFIKLYTSGINDADYLQPLFALCITLSAFSYCLRLPYHSMIIAAGHFKQTSIAAYGEAFINISLSLILVFRYNLVGVAIATLIATWFRFIYYVIYLSRNILFRKEKYFYIRFLVNILSLIINILLGRYITSIFLINSFFVWALNGFLLIFLFSCSTLLVNLICLKKDIHLIFRKLKK